MFFLYVGLTHAHSLKDPMLHFSDSFTLMSKDRIRPRQVSDCGL